MAPCNCSPLDTMLLPSPHLVPLHTFPASPVLHRQQGHSKKRYLVTAPHLCFFLYAHESTGAWGLLDSLRMGLFVKLSLLSVSDLINHVYLIRPPQKTQAVGVQRFWDREKGVRPWGQTSMGTEALCSGPFQTCPSHPFLWLFIRSLQNILCNKLVIESKALFSVL